MIVPQAIEDNIPLVTAFMEDVHGYTDCILSILSREINLGKDLKDCHRKDRPSSANMAMLKYLAWGSDDEKTGNMAHTDMGTLTVVFSKTPGLQALLPGSDDWSFIPPREGHAVVNVGDSLRFLSGGVLTSSLHRVVPPADSVAKDKFSVIYFLRPEFDAKFTTHQGKQINSQGAWSHVDRPPRVSWGDWKLILTHSAWASNPSEGNCYWNLSLNTSLRVVGEPLSLFDRGDRRKSVERES
jgi:isopenicillin N synthase-like dioxygenase